MYVLFVGWCLHSLIFVFIHLFDLPHPIPPLLLTNQSNSHWTSRLGFHIGFFPTSSVFLSIRLLKPTFLFFGLCVSKCCRHWSCCLFHIDWAPWAWGIFCRAGVLWLMYFWSFVIQSFQPSCLLLWISNYCSGREWCKL